MYTVVHTLNWYINKMQRNLESLVLGSAVHYAFIGSHRKKKARVSSWIFRASIQEAESFAAKPGAETRGQVDGRYLCGSVTLPGCSVWTLAGASELEVSPHTAPAMFVVHSQTLILSRLWKRLVTARLALTLDFPEICFCIYCLLEL